MKQIAMILRAAALLVAVTVAVAAPVGAQSEAGKTYQAKCAVCHGADGKGTASGQKKGARDFGSAGVQKQSDEKLAEIISKGKHRMPAFKELSLGEVKALVAYCRELGEKK